MGNMPTAALCCKEQRDEKTDVQLVNRPQRAFNKQTPRGFTPRLDKQRPTALLASAEPPETLGVVASSSRRVSIQNIGTSELSSSEQAEHDQGGNPQTGDASQASAINWSHPSMPHIEWTDQPGLGNLRKRAHGVQPYISPRCSDDYSDTHLMGRNSARDCELAHNPCPRLGSRGTHLLDPVDETGSNANNRIMAEGTIIRM